MKFFVIGYGLIGKERVKALLKMRESMPNIITDIFVYDPNLKVEELPLGVKVAERDSFIENIPEYVIIATPHYVTREWLEVVSKWGSRILVEKPFGRTLKEAEDMFLSLIIPQQAYVGFNYRFYEGVRKLEEDLLDKRFGKIISVKMELGHGGSPNDRNSWKLDPFKGSADCLLDPGIHFLDLLQNRFFSEEEIVPLYGRANYGFWNTGVMEEINLLLKAGETTINLTTSLVRWRSTFFIEINGTNGYGKLWGKGRSYGHQYYVTGERWGWMKDGSQLKNEIVRVESSCDDSFYQECLRLVAGGVGNCSAFEAFQTMKLYDECRKVIH